MIIVENKKPKLTHLAPGVTLRPGVNVLKTTKEEEAWASYSKTKVGKAKLESDSLVVVDSTVLASPDDDDEPGSLLAGYAEKEALRLVKATLDAALLEQWAAEESREKVASAIAKQLEKLAVTEADKKANASKPESKETVSE